MEKHTLIQKAKWQLQSVGRVLHTTKGSADTWRPRQSIINLKRHYWMWHSPSITFPCCFQLLLRYIEAIKPMQTNKTWDTKSDRPQVESCCGAGSEQQLRSSNKFSLPQCLCVVLPTTTSPLKHKSSYMYIIPAPPRVQSWGNKAQQPLFWRKGRYIYRLQ